MSNEIRSLEPKALWKNFADLNAIPRPSKKEEKVRQLMIDFGENLNLETIVDPVGNVIIKKPASAGMENRKTIVMQSHLDMISFGPTIKGAHSPDERASISSSQKYWKYLLEILKNIPTV